MPVPKLGVLIGDSGVTSLSVLASGPHERASALRLLDVIRPEIEAFDYRLKNLLEAACGAGARDK